ncbi:hypothetical protein ACWDR3_17175, partial [Streptomyces sp. NPDC001002]
MSRTCPAPAGTSHPDSVIQIAFPECDRWGGSGHRRVVKNIHVKSIKWLTTTDHKTIGTLYLVTSFAFFLIGGVMA